MKNKYLLASTPTFLGIIFMIIHSLTSGVAADGFLIEPFFFLVPTSFILFFISFVSLLFMFINSVRSSKENLID